MRTIDIHTHVLTEEGAVSFQEYFTQLACEPPVRGFQYAGAAEARLSDEVLDALHARSLEAVVTAGSTVVLAAPLDAVMLQLRDVFALARPGALIIDVAGANPTSTQTATLQLWSGRAPAATANGAFAALAEAFVDNTTCCGAGSSNQTFGSLAGLTAGGRNVTVDCAVDER